MRRALIATVGTVVGLEVLLDNRSGAPIGRAGARVGGETPVPSAPSTSPLPTTTPTTGTTSPTGPSPATTAPAGPAQYTGVDVPYQYGDIEVRITVAGGRVTAISIPQESATDPRSQSINAQAVPILTQEALAAQNLQFDVVSGATFTSDAFAQAFQSAMNKAGR